MKLETIKKDKKKNILIGGLIILVLVSVIAFTTTRAKYKSVQSMKLATGTVKFKEYDFKVMAMYKSEDGTNYSDTEVMPGSDYVINEDKSYCTIDGTTQQKGKLKTIDGHHVMENLSKSEKCYMWFDKYIPPITIDDIIYALEHRTDGSYKGTTTPTFTSTATEAETEDNNGIFKTSDPMYGGDTYYWRGAATTNYVMFASKCWRIVRINGDKTMRLIYDGTTCHANGVDGQQNTDSIAFSGQTYSKDSNTNNNSSYVGWTYTMGSQRPTDNTTATASGIKTATENWFNNNSNFTAVQREKVADGKFCNDRRTKDNASWVQNGSNTTQYYAAYARLKDGNKIPSFDCYKDTTSTKTDIYILKVGAITADEVQFAGASADTTNKQYYLYNGKYYWTMSPYSWAYGYANVFTVYPSGNLGSDWVINAFGVRPVINLKANTLFNEDSNGTLNNPYVVKET